MDQSNDEYNDLNSNTSETNDPHEVYLVTMSQNILSALCGLSPQEAIEVLANAMNCYAYANILVTMKQKTGSLPEKPTSINEFMEFYKNDVMVNGETVTNSIGRQSMMMYLWLISNTDKK